MEPKALALAISHMLENDREFQDIMDQVARYEPTYQRILQCLSPEDRDALELYVAACEDAQYYRIYPAYSLAYREAKRKDAKRIKKQLSD